MDPKEIAIEAFYADSHPLLDKWVEANGIDAEREGFGVNLDELIAFAGLLPAEDLAALRA
jgi:hypothetical protein